MRKQWYLNDWEISAEKCKLETWNDDLEQKKNKFKCANFKKLSKEI